MTWLRVVLGLYGLINVGGGIAGFATAGSTMSLVAGVGAGIAILVLTALTFSFPAMAYRSLGGVCLLLAAFWAYRITVLQGEGKSPGMALGNLGLALVVLGCLAFAHFAAQKKRAA